MEIERFPEPCVKEKRMTYGRAARDFSVNLARLVDRDPTETSAGQKVSLQRVHR